MKAALFPDATGVKALANSLLIAPSQRILQNAWFNGTIIACIVIAGANVGVQRWVYVAARAYPIYGARALTLNFGISLQIYSWKLFIRTPPPRPHPYPCPIPSYPDMEDNTVLKVADDIILALFTLEVRWGRRE